MSDCLIRLENIRKDFGSKEVLKSINLDVHDKEFVTFLGPSGCGKTTTLRIIGGFVEPDHGNVFFDGRRINALPAYRRRVNTIFQRYALFPHLNVYENVAFGMRVQRKKNAEIRETVERMLRLVNLAGFEKRKVDTLSGGQQQRVAIARALANNPSVLLLDEPLAALDLKLRKDMQVELKNIQKSLGITFVYVTHDQEEALSMSDTVVVMDNGVIQQIGSPQDIYNEPENAFVADFIGESNILDGIMHEDRLVEFFGRKFRCVDTGFERMEPVDVVIRPEDVDIVPPDQGHLTGTVTNVTFKGVHFETIVDFKGFKWMIQTTDYHPVESVIGISLNPEDIHIMKKSKYSGMFGDYSSYSEEFDEMANPEIDLTEESGGETE